MRQEYLCCRQEYLFLDFLLLDIHAFFHNLGHHVPSVNLHFESSTEWLLWMIGSKYSEKVVQDTLKKVICQLAYSFDKWACSCYAILHAIGCAKITRFTTFHWLSVLSDFWLIIGSSLQAIASIHPKCWKVKSPWPFALLPSKYIFSYTVFQVFPNPLTFIPQPSKFSLNQ